MKGRRKRRKKNNQCSVSRASSGMEALFGMLGLAVLQIKYVYTHKNLSFFTDFEAHIDKFGHVIHCR